MTSPAPAGRLAPETLPAYFARAWQAAAAAAEPGLAWREVPLGGGLSLPVHFGNQRLQDRLGAALAHAPMHGGGALGELRFAADGPRTALPPPPWTTSDYGPRGEVQGLAEFGLRAIYNFDSGCLSLHDATHRRGLVWLRRPDDLPAYERAAPALAAISWLLTPTLPSPEPQLLVHGAAVGTSSGALLLAGRGGSGKSTSALAALASGMEYLGDDYCLLQLATGGPRVRRLYASAKADLARLGHWPELQTESAQGALDGAKQLLLLAGAHRARMVEERPLRALVLPQVEPDLASHRLEPASPAAALRALAPSTIFQLAGAGAPTARVLARLANALPVFRLRLCPAVHDVPAVLRDLLARLGPP